MRMPKIPKSPIASPKKIAKRGLYEIMWSAGKKDYKSRDHGKRLK